MSPIFSNNSEANALELLENIGETDECLRKKITYSDPTSYYELRKNISSRFSRKF